MQNNNMTGRWQTEHVLSWARSITQPPFTGLDLARIGGWMQAPEHYYSHGQHCVIEMLLVCAETLWADAGLLK